jgi:uncharacterized protein (TIGR02594 family)
MNITAFDIAQRFVGIREVKGSTANPLILAMLRLDNRWPQDDEVPWCSSFPSYVCWLLRLPRSKSLAARSWLNVGVEVGLEDAVPSYDVVVLKRGGTHEPGPEIARAPGHVGFFAGLTENHVQVLGGNQDDSVSVAWFPREQVLSVRRLHFEEG